jgi:hypothetical protein
VTSALKALKGRKRHVSGAPWLKGEGGLGGTSRKPNAIEEGS